MKKALFIICLIGTLTTYAQNDLNQYLKTHSYSFSLDKGFDQSTSDVLQQKLSQYKIVLQAEGGSHYLDIYTQLPFVWLSFLNTRFGLTRFFFETGHSADLLFNKYLETGDTSYIFIKDKTFWRLLYAFNAGLPENKRITTLGIDFESSYTYVKALKLILPSTVPPVNIQPSIELIKAANDTFRNCDYILSIKSELKKNLLNNKESFIQYFGDKYLDFERLVLNAGSCKDKYKNRNNNMAANFLAFDKAFNNTVYYGELGEAHTVLINKNTASILNNSAAFKDKVCVVNLYCYNCTTPEEKVSNWPLAKIEKDILQYFLPYCTSDFTLFNLSDKSDIIKKYSEYGQFLIIAKDQH